METEKRRYLGNHQLNELEERLFEILFLRQEIPLLPLHWGVDFRAVPMSGDLFCWKTGVKPIVYAHTSGFRAATMALSRLIDLTANVRTSCQSGLRRKTPLMIKKSLDKYLSWAAEDGGYSHLKYIPNITVEIVDKTGEGLEEHQLTAFVGMRMRQLAQSHRELLAIKAEQEENSADMDIDRELLRRPVIKPESHGETSVIDSGDDEPTTKQGNKARDRVYVKLEDEEEEKQTIIKKELFDDSDDDITMADIPMAPTTSYLRPPPVVFGFFIVSTSVILLTADSSKEDADMKLNYHVDLDFQNRSLGVWNALTVAIATCLARDDMMKRMGDFEEEIYVEESDPDA
ncbi:uncharacterized protein TRIVIDRAFT_54591 [Trichoderma virens Gv29-8]|uniref:Uncharacterized protein n=1 Tax=Hypocrea virens (strain Gv29-8 / FGSC 10586) TaxID=413071 RepID=G9MKZ7_HYPVG|nr:uncharacterized protein TRIVIDRAFT_54591 [Trichoderma virens Gv29-8]EHK24891.1 hypothetical protein TRIVIDRAFT_54591 [Trichoderma virens Gv29-8]